MDYNIATRIKDVQGSIIRELFKLTRDPDIIPFAGGSPDPSAFPVRETAEIAAEILAENPVSVLQYGMSEGYGPLRDTMRTHLRKTEGLDLERDELFCISGAQQAADLITKVFVNEGDAIIVEGPSFIGCLNAFRSYGAKLVDVRMEPDGMQIDALDAALRNTPNVRFIYTIPNFQNPTGYTTSFEKRKQIYALAQQYNVLIFEDNPYAELRFSGEAVPPIKSLDTDGRVLYATSFSKTMAPAFRVGMLAFDRELTERLTVAKQCTDVHTTVLFQHICHKFMTAYDYDAHIAKIQALYARKAGLMLDAMAAHFHPAVQYNRPEGGMFVMAFLPEGQDAWSFVQEGIARKVACVPGVAFAADQNMPNNGFRLNFSAPAEEKIVQGIEILGKLTHEWLSK